MNECKFSWSIFYCKILWCLCIGCVAGVGDDGGCIIGGAVRHSGHSNLIVISSNGNFGLWWYRQFSFNIPINTFHTDTGEACSFFRVRLPTDPSANGKERSRNGNVFSQPLCLRMIHAPPFCSNVLLAATKSGPVQSMHLVEWGVWVLLVAPINARLLSH